MNTKHRKTLQAIFSDPIDGALEWSRIEALLLALGCDVVEGSGSAVSFRKDGVILHVHRPHPGKEALRYRVRLARDFLDQIEWE
ncbi:MAG: type II toxin-antitoxin system HicA family toxin [Zoogloeaceae bacterium]|nr:type II toxin-antitoxin system HicA family toxin [Zoogloeaceae bacterium]